MLSGDDRALVLCKVGRCLLRLLAMPNVLILGESCEDNPTIIPVGAILVLSSCMKVLPTSTE